MLKTNLNSKPARQIVRNFDEAVQAFTLHAPAIKSDAEGVGYHLDSAGHTLYAKIDTSDRAGDRLAFARRKDFMTIASVFAGRYDATDLLFAARQLEHVIAQVFVPEKSPLLRGKNVVRSSTLPRGATSYTQYMVDGTGKFEWVSSKAGSTVPVVDLSGGGVARPVHEARLGARLDIREIEQGDFGGLNVLRESVNVVRRAADEIHNRVMCFGDANLNLSGLFKLNGAKEAASPANGSGSSRYWSAKSTTNIIADLKTLVADNQIAAKGSVMFDTIIVPPSTMAYLATAPFDTASGQTSVLEYLKKSYPALTWVEAYEAGSSWPDQLAVRNEGFITVVDSRFVDYKTAIEFDQGTMKEEDYGLRVPFRISSGGIHTMNPQAVAYLTNVEA